MELSKLTPFIEQKKDKVYFSYYRIHVFELNLFKIRYWIRKYSSMIGFTTQLLAFKTKRTG